MDGWTGQILRVNLTTRTHRIEPFSEEFAHSWIGGRGFAVKILYDELAPGIDPLGPENKLVVAVGPISGISAPNTGKTVVAAKSPMTGGYGDGNLGTRVTEKLRKAGYDALIVEGRAERPTLLYIDDDRVEFVPAEEIWGKGTYEANDWIYARYGKGAGVLNIGQGGENLVRYAVVRSMEGRSGGQAGHGRGDGVQAPQGHRGQGVQAHPPGLPRRDEDDRARRPANGARHGPEGGLVGAGHHRGPPLVQRGGRPPGAQLPQRPSTPRPGGWTASGWRRPRWPSTAAPTAPCSAGSPCSTPRAASRSWTTRTWVCSAPTSTCTTYSRWPPSTTCATTSGSTPCRPGACSASTPTPSSRGRCEGDLRFGDFAGFRDAPRRTSPSAGARWANLLAEGTMRAARVIGGGSEAYAMQVKGLEVSAYNCKFIPGMALAFGVSPIGAHHKESWIISYEITQTPRESYGREKAQKVVDLQRIRGGMFESIVSCRFPWVELGFGLENYPKYYNTVTGRDWELEDFWPSADRIYALMKLFWLREFPDTDRRADYPPAVWFDPANADTEGPIAGRHLEYDRYDALLQHYYDIRGYDEPGHPHPRDAGAARAGRRGGGRGALRHSDVKVIVRLIGGLAHRLGFTEQEIDLPAGTTAGALLAGLGIDHPGSVLTTRDGQGIALDDPLGEGDRILISPPFSGG